MYDNQFRQKTISDINTASTPRTESVPTCNKAENQIAVDGSETKATSGSGGIRLWEMHPALWLGLVIGLSALAIWGIPKLIKGKVVPTV